MYNHIALSCDLIDIIISSSSTICSVSCRDHSNQAEMNLLKKTIPSRIGVEWSGNQG